VVRVAFDQLGFIERLLFAPVENDDISVKYSDITRMRFNSRDSSLETCEWSRLILPDFDAISNLESELPFHNEFLMSYSSKRQRIAAGLREG